MAAAALLTAVGACAPEYATVVAKASGQGMSVEVVEAPGALGHVSVARADIHWVAGMPVAEIQLDAPPGTRVAASATWWDTNRVPLGRDQSFAQLILFGASPRQASLWRAPVPQAIRAEIVIFNAWPSE